MLLLYYLFAHNKRELFYENPIEYSIKDYTTLCTIFGSFYYITLDYIGLVMSKRL
ncbi:Uncharacterised protein [Streptococcus pneumoniae]|nr:Uncharacterised protein [Streptococcus pneumoniae]